MHETKGLAFTRLAIAMTIAKDDSEAATNIARVRWGEESFPYRILKAGGPTMLLHRGGEMDMIHKSPQPAGATTAGSWAADLVSLESAASEFFGLVRAPSLIGRIPGLRNVPLRTRLVGAVSGVTAAWVGEGRAKPVSSATYNVETLPSRKVATMIVVTEELLKSLDPAAETMIRDDMIAACVETIDRSFIDPANAGDTDIEPASITYGAPSIAASGDGLQDLRELIASFPGDLERAVLIGSPASFAVLHDPLFLPGLGVRGGEAIGVPAFASTAAGDTLALVDPAGIAVGEAEMGLRTSRQADIEMETEPTNSAVTPTATTMVSLWQTNAGAILAEKIINWQVARPAVSVISGMAPS